MTLREILHAPRRRWPVAAIAFALVLAGAWILTRLAQGPRFKARARLCLALPPSFAAAHDLPWVCTGPLDPPTWISILESRKIRSAAFERIRQRPEYVSNGGALREWPDSIAAGSDNGGPFLWIEATGSSAALAADLANAVAQSAEEEGRGMARLQAEATLGKIRKILEVQTAALRQLELEQRRTRERAGPGRGSDDLDAEARSLREEVLAEETRRGALERRSSANRLRLERLRQDRSTLEHLEREAIPRAASVPIRTAIHPEVKAASERLESVHRALDDLLRKVPRDPSAIQAGRADLRAAELEISRVETLAIAADLSAEESALRAENESIRLETALLDPTLQKHRDRLTLLSPVLEGLRKLDREIADEKASQTSLDTLALRLSPAPADGGFVRTEQRAQAADAVPAGPRTGSHWPLALAAAILAGFSFALLSELLDPTFRSDADVRRHLGYSVLALVPKVGAREVLAIHPGRSSIVSEVYDTLATVLLSAPSVDASRIVLITGTNPGEGKTSVAINLAVALALQGKRTLLVDGDLRVPAVHAALGLVNSTGFSDLLAGLVDLGTDGVLQDVGVPSLKVMSAGPAPENPHELLDPARIAPVAAMFRGQFDAVVIDTPPVRRVGDALKLSALSDAILFVVRSGVTDVRQATWAKRLLASVNARVTGAVLNGGTTKPEVYYTYDSRREAPPGP